MAEHEFFLFLVRLIADSRHELNSPVYASRHLIRTTSHNTETKEKEENEIEFKNESLMTKDKRDGTNS